MNFYTLLRRLLSEIAHAKHRSRAQRSSQFPPTAPHRPAPGIRSAQISHANKALRSVLACTYAGRSVGPRLGPPWPRRFFVQNHGTTAPSPPETRRFAGRDTTAFGAAPAHPNRPPDRSRDGGSADSGGLVSPDRCRRAPLSCARGSVENPRRSHRSSRSVSQPPM